MVPGLQAGPSGPAPVSGTPVRRGPRRPSLAAGATLLLLALLVGVPLTELVRVAGEGGVAGIVHALRSPGAPAAVAHTLEIAAAVTVIAVCAGAALALAVERRCPRTRNRLRVLLATPLVVPEFVLGFAWSQAYGRAGVGDQLTGFALPGLFGPAGIVLVLSAHAVPLAYLATTAGLAAWVQPDQERAARVCGAGPWTTLRTVTLPLLRSALLAAAVLVFVTAVGSFAVPQVLGSPAGYSTMSTLVYRSLALSADPAAFVDLTVLALTMAVLVLVVVGAADLVLPARRTGGQPSGAAARSPAPGRGDPALVAVVYAFVLLTVAIPLLAVLLAAMTRGVGLPPAPANMTFRHFSAALSGPTGPALARTASLALAAALLVPLLGALAATAGGSAAARTRWRGVLATLVTLAFAVPGSALAVGVMIGYGRWLGGSAAIILVAYLGKFWILGHRAVQAGLDRIPTDVTRAARVSGAGRATAARTVLLPPLRAALLIAAALAFLLATHEVTMSTVLYGPGSETFAVVILNDRDLGDVGATSALAVILTAPVLLAITLALVVAPLRSPRPRLRRGARR
jgi:iron(III) transport system permease protein